jgi:ribosomal protein S18 acetylase RimI-like enzyme
MDIKITKAEISDLHEILRLQKLAYQKEANLYDDWSIPPLTQTINDIEEEYLSSLFLKAQFDDIVGSVRASIEYGTCRIGRLIVHPDHQRKGIGSLLVKKIEESFPDANRFELFTGTKSVDSIRLYRKLGYKEYREHDLSEKVKIVFMEKVNPSL